MVGEGADGRPRHGDPPATVESTTVGVPAQRPAPAEDPPPLPAPRPAGPAEQVTERLPPVPPDPAQDQVPDPVPDAGRRRGPARPRDRGGPGRRGRRADLAVASGGLLALVGFLLAPHTATPDGGPLTLPELIGLTEADEPTVGLLRLVGAGAAVVALAGATAAGLRGRWVRTALHAGALAVAALLLLGYALVGLAALRAATPALAPGAAVVAVGLLLAFVGALAALTDPR